MPFKYLKDRLYRTLGGFEDFLADPLGDYGATRDQHRRTSKDLLDLKKPRPQRLSPSEIQSASFLDRGKIKLSFKVFESVVDGTNKRFSIYFVLHQDIEVGNLLDGPAGLAGDKTRPTLRNNKGILTAFDMNDLYEKAMKMVEEGKLVIFDERLDAEYRKYINEIFDWAESAPNISAQLSDMIGISRIDWATDGGSLYLWKGINTMFTAQGLKKGIFDEQGNVKPEFIKVNEEFKKLMAYFEQAETIAKKYSVVPISAK